MPPGSCFCLFFPRHLCSEGKKSLLLLQTLRNLPVSYTWAHQHCIWEVMSNLYLSLLKFVPTSVPSLLCFT